MVILIQVVIQNITATIIENPENMEKSYTISIFETKDTLNAKMQFCRLPADVCKDKDLTQIDVDLKVPQLHLVMSEETLKKLLDIINPENEAGKITLICRFGHDKIRDALPKLVKPFINSDHKLIWSCDPMHGNTIKSNSGFKTRPFERVLNEVESFFDIHHELGTYPGGVHLEMTGQNVTECMGGAQAIKDEDLSARYHTHCDPRLNASQAIELAFLISGKLRQSQESNNPKITIAN